MSVTRALLLLALAVPASAAELKTLKDGTIKGDLVSLSDKEIVLSADGKEVRTPIDQVLLLSLKDGPDKLPADTKYAEVELIDGSRFRCARVEMKGKEAKLFLLQGQEVSLPIAKITYVLNDAYIGKNRADFKERVLDKKKVRDIVALRKGDILNPVPGTLGDADEKGEGTISFTLASGGTRSVPLAKVGGLYFQRKPDPKAQPVLCRFHDASQNLLYASSVAKTEDGYTVTTSAGVTVKYTPDKIVRLDYSRGKLTFLADLTPASLKETSTEGVVQHYRRNENLDGGKIHMNGKPYDSGIALHSTTELEYDLEGEYREFRAVVGIDDDVSGDDGPTLLKIEGDGNVLLEKTFSRKDKQRVQPIALNVKDIKKLKISVSSGDILDLGKHLTLADARVSK
jgi:hypothetical protein